MSPLIPLAAVAIAMTAVSGWLVLRAWRHGFGEASVYVSMVHMLGAVVMLIVAGDYGWPTFVLVAAWMSVLSAVVAVPVGDQRRERARAWEAFEREFRFYATTRGGA